MQEGGYLAQTDHLTIPAIAHPRLPEHGLFNP